MSDRKVYEQKEFHGRIFHDYRDLSSNPLYVDFKKNGLIENGYNCGMYIQEECNENSIRVTCLGTYAHEIRKHDWLFKPEKLFDRRMRFIQAKLDI